jgi:hypothetical protein
VTRKREVRKAGSRPKGKRKSRTEERRKKIAKKPVYRGSRRRSDPTKKNAFILYFFRNVLLCVAFFSFWGCSLSIWPNTQKRRGEAEKRSLID